MTRAREILVLKVCTWEKEKKYVQELKDWLEGNEVVIWVDLDLQVKSLWHVLYQLSLSRLSYTVYSTINWLKSNYIPKVYCVFLKKTLCTHYLVIVEGFGLVVLWWTFLHEIYVLYLVIEDSNKWVIWPPTRGIRSRGSSGISWKSLVCWRL